VLTRVILLTATYAGNIIDLASVLLNTMNEGSSAIPLIRYQYKMVEACRNGSGLETQ
jgi:hypothetical protein